LHKNLDHHLLTIYSEDFRRPKKMENVTLVSVVKAAELPTRSAPLRMAAPPKTSSNEPSLQVKFVSAGLAACMGDLVTFPLDTAKVRLQVPDPG